MAYRQNTNEANRSRIVYLNGDDTTDGSIRIMLNSGEIVSHIEARKDGVWNDTSFRFASSSVFIGRDFTLSAAAGFIETKSLSTLGILIQSLVPETQFTDIGTEQPKTPILKAREEFVIFTDPVSETIGNIIGINLGASATKVLGSSRHEVGSVGASSSVTVSLHKGVDNTGFLIDRRVLPPVMLLANTALVIDYFKEVGFLAGDPIFMEFASSSAISLKTDAADNPLTIIDGQEMSTLELLTENLIYDIGLNYILDSSLNPVYSNQFN